MYTKTSAQKFMILWKEMCFTGYQAFRTLSRGVCSSFLFLRLITRHHIFLNHVEDVVRFICLLVIFIFFGQSLTHVV